MENRKMLLASLLSIALVFSLILPASVAGVQATMPPPDDQNITHLAADSSSAAMAMALNTPQGNVTPMVAAGWYHTVGLKDDGTVVAVGDNSGGQCDVGNWTGITQVAAGGSDTVGLKSDGTVVAVGENYYGQCDVGGWGRTSSRSPQAPLTRWGLNPTAPWSPTETTPTGSVMSITGPASDRSLQVAGWASTIPVVVTR